MSCVFRSSVLAAASLAAVLLCPPGVNAQQNAQPTSQTPVAVAQVPLSAPRVPLPNRVNEMLPSWLRVRGEFRERVEGFQSGGFVDGRDDTYALSRVRVNATVTASKHLSFQANVQDARVAKKQVGPTTAPFRGPFDLRAGFADIGDAMAPMAFRLGRQELAFGEQRLLGHLAWVNTGRTWDAARVILRAKGFQADVFGASLVRSLPDGFDKSGNGNRLAGVYATTPKVVPQASVEPFLFWRRDVNLRSELGTIGDLAQTTMGVRVAGKLPAYFDYGVEMAMQRGSLAADSVNAWAGHWQIRESLPGRGAVKLTSEYNFATGDDNPTDGSRRTFDQLYPTGHDKLGLADQVGWRNVHHLREGFEFLPFKATPLSVNYHSWWLAERADGLYAASGALLARVVGGAASSHVGQEVDVQISRALTPQIQIAGGYAHIFTGAFLEQATPGASYSHPYVMVTYVFLAER
ncbi:MAG TPA: alginate export family protein [Vicinamibacterales bacterium]|nr:alginate export family protein [Vicinamibacterales bacterium]